MLLAAAALTRPGEVILTEALTYYGIKSIAGPWSASYTASPWTTRACVPDALEAAIRSTGARALYCIPTLQNPTTTVMPETRRRRIAEICRRHDVTIIEDDIYGFLLEGAATPLSSPGAGARASTSPACRSAWRRACGSATCVHPWPTTTGSRRP